MKMTAPQSPDCYPLDVYALRRASDNQISARNNQRHCFENEMVSGNFTKNGVGSIVTPGHSDESYCTFSNRHLMDFEDSALRQYALNGMNNDIPQTVEDNFAKFADSIRSEIDTIPHSQSPNKIEVDIRNFETSAKDALADFTKDLINLFEDQMELISLAYDKLTTSINGSINNADNNIVAEIPDIENTGDDADSAATDPQHLDFDKIEGLLNLVQEKTELINQAFDELITAISGNFDSGNKNSVAEIPDTENTRDVANPVASDPLPFNFDEFETKLREKFMAALDELLERLRETTTVQDNFVVKGNRAAYASLSGAYDQMMAITNSSNHDSERVNFETLA